MVAEQAFKLDEQTCKLDEQTDQIVLLINENIDLRATIVRLNEDKEELEVELRLRKKASRKPDIKPPAESGKVRGGLAGQEKGKGKGGGGAAGKRRRGRKRGRDTAERVEVLIEDPPEGSHRKDFVERYVQVLRIDTQHLVYRLERRILPDGTTVTAELPTPATGNFSSTVESFALLAYHEGQSTMPRVARMLRGFGLDISGRQVKRLPAKARTPSSGRRMQSFEPGSRGPNGSRSTTPVAATRAGPAPAPHWAMTASASSEPPAPRAG